MATIKLMKFHTQVVESHREHVDKFLECIKTHSTPSCPPQVGRTAALHAHTPNIAARTGEPVLEWDDANNKFTNSDKANAFIIPECRKPWKLPEI